VTPGNGGRDPLDDWLDREIRPLPPPAGAFEAVSRRARHRKMGKLAMAASSVAAVVVATAVVVPSLLTPPSARPVADGSQASNRSAGPAASANSNPPSGTANKESRAATASPTSVGAATGSTGPYPVGGAVPANFQPTSVTFIGANTGWAIGQGGTPGSCANSNPDICTSLVLTQDGGQTWRGVTAPGTANVSGIRFYNGQYGWAYGPELWSTQDYGHSWQEDNTSGKVVTDLETENGRAFAVFASCSTTVIAPSIAFYGERCANFSLETASAGSDDGWTPITFSGADGGNTLSVGTDGSGAVTKPTIMLQGGTGWLVGPQGQVFSGSLTSSTWAQVSTSPCPTSSQAGGSAMLDWSLATGDLILACNGAQATTVYSSADGGGTWTEQATAPGFGTAESLTASPAAPDILATTEGIEALDANGQWQQVASVQGGFSYVGMTTDDQGIALPANVSLHQVWMTYNGGLSWTPVSLVP
jgi:hypothetical protein